MLIRPSVGAAIEQDEIKGFARTITEIEWLLLILVLIYLVAGGQSGESRAAITMAPSGVVAWIAFGLAKSPLAKALAISRRWARMASIDFASFGSFAATSIAPPVGYSLK